MEQHIGLVIKELREERKLSKARLAREAGFSDAYLVQIEKGQRTPSHSVLMAIAKALKVAPHRLLIPAGRYDEKSLARAQEITDKRAEQLATERGRDLTEPERERLLSLVLDEVEMEMAQDEYWNDPEARLESYRDAMRHDDPLALADDEFWGWDSKTSWAPEHWSSLSERDRKLVQQLINRLVQLADE